MNGMIDNVKKKNLFADMNAFHDIIKKLLQNRVNK